MQGAGNDFVVVEADSNHCNWSELAVKMCDRHYGVGADGLLILSPSKVADFKMRIFNADGSESAVCGNGLRCLVKHYIDGNTQRKNSEIKIETSIDVRTARIHRHNGVVAEIQVNMGEPKIGINSIAVKEINKDSILDIKSVMNCTLEIDGTNLLLSLVSVGNPHAVHFAECPLTDFPLATSERKTLKSPSTSCGVRTAVGSSRIRISASRYKTLMISTRCCEPTGRSPI